MANIKNGRLLDRERGDLVELVKVAEQLNAMKLLLVQNAAEVLLIQQEMEQQAGKEAV